MTQTKIEIMNILIEKNTALTIILVYCIIALQIYEYRVYFVWNSPLTTSLVSSGNNIFSLNVSIILMI